MGNQPSFVVVASDGIWNVFKNHKLIYFINKRIKEQLNETYGKESTKRLKKIYISDYQKKIRKLESELAKNEKEFTVLKASSPKKGTRKHKELEEKINKLNVKILDKKNKFIEEIGNIDKFGKKYDSKILQPELICEEIIDNAIIKRGSNDNCSIIIVIFKDHSIFGEDKLNLKKIIEDAMENPTLNFFKHGIDVYDQQLYFEKYTKKKLVHV